MTAEPARSPDPLSPPAAEAAAPAAPAPVDTPAPLRLSAVEQQAAMARGALTAEALMEATLAQIGALNGAVNAIVQLRDPAELMEEARAADAERAAGRRPGPLHGIPMAFKEMVPAKGFRATSGSPLLASLPPNAADGLLASRMKAAGAIPIGKTNIPEFGLGSHSFNPVYGAVRNPWDLSCSAGGSSGGAGVALALRMVSVADGSDLMGSLRNPAGWNNVWGLRPSQGRIPSESSRDVFLHQLATEGPMARSVADLAMLLEVQAGPHPDHPLALPALAPGLSARIGDGTLAGARIGWVGDWNGHLPLAPDMAALLDAARARLEALGAEVVPVVPDVSPEAVWEAWIDLRAWMVASKAAVFLDDPSLRAGLKPEAVWEAERGRSLSALDIHRAAETRADLHRAMAALEAEYDALALPVAQLFPFPVHHRFPAEVGGRAMDTYHRWMECVVLSSLSGRPAVSMPAGFSPGGLPGGLQLVGRWAGEEGLLRLAAAWERAMPAEWRAAPPLLSGA